MRDERLMEAVKDTFYVLYQNAEPSANYFELCKNTTTFEDEYGKKVVTDAPLDDKELHIRRWRRDIGFENYRMEQEKFVSIVESQIKKWKIRDTLSKQRFRNAVYLGPSPCTYTKRKESN